MRDRDFQALAEQCRLDSGHFDHHRFRTAWEQSLGIEQQRDNANQPLDPRFNKDRPLRAKDVSLEQIAHLCFGRHFGASEVKEAFRVASNMSGYEVREQAAIAEAEGASVLPSSMANISMFDSAAAGLAQAIALEEIAEQGYIYDEVSTARSFLGWYMLGVRRDRTDTGPMADPNKELGDDEPYPARMLGETKVSVPRSRRHGAITQLNEFTSMNDLTGQLQTAAQENGAEVGFTIEREMADVVTGIKNTYSRDGVSSNTYRKTADSIPNNYINSKGSTPLADWRDVNTAWVELHENTDPHTGRPVNPWGPDFRLLCSYRNILNNRTILFPSFVRVGESSLGATSQLREAANPLAPIGLDQLASWTKIWHDRLVLASASGGGGLSDTDAANLWMLGNFKKAFGRRVIWPLTTTTLPISSAEIRRDIVAQYLTRERSNPFIVEPRYVWQGTNGA